MLFKDRKEKASESGSESNRVRSGKNENKKLENASLIAELVTVASLLVTYQQERQMLFCVPRL